MTLQELQNEMINAMKQGNKIKKDILSSAIAAIKKVAIDQGCRDNISEELVNTVLLKEQKILQEQIDTCPDTHAKLKNEYLIKMGYLKKYVPQLITDEEEIFAIIRGELAAAGIEMKKANRGAIMKLVMPILKGKADMKIVNKVIEGELG